MFDANRRVAEALDVPLRALNLWIYGGFACLAVGGAARIPWLAYIAVAAGVGLAVAGARAVIRPARPFNPGVPTMTRLLSSSRAVGAFYAVAGVVWVLVALAAAQEA